jgi:hypothetical protein
MKKFYVIICLFISSMAFGQAPLLIEDFNYSAADLLTAHGWNAHSGGTTNAVAVTAPGLTFTGYIGSGIGNAAGVNNTGQDVNKLFPELTSGSIYVSFLLNSTATSATGSYFFHFFDPNAATAFRARTFIISNTGKMQIGFSFNASAAQGLSSTLLDFGTTYLVVAKYTIVSGIENDIVSLYIFKAGDDFSTEPVTPFLGPFTATNTTPGDPLTPLGPDIRPYGIGLRQFDAAQRITVDGFRVKTSWDLAADVAPTMIVSTNTLTVAAVASSTNTFDITSNAPWAATSDQTWLTISKASGYGNATMTVTAGANPTTSTRTANVTVTSDGVTTQTIVVTQDAGPATLAVSSNTLTIAAAASSTKSFDIISNTDWAAASDQSWLTVGTLTGTGNASITLTAAENTGATTRSATVTVSATGLTSQTITVTQDAAANLSVSSNTLTIAAIANSTTTFDITSNVNWTAASDQTWLTVGTLTGSGNASITLTATANPTITSRSATVSVSAVGVTTQSITVTQDGAAVILTVSSNTLTIAAAANSTNTFNITSNTDWAAASDQTWLTVGTLTGSGNATITLTAAVNTVTSTRSATVTVSASGANNQIITVTQDASTTGINEITVRNIDVYPNPVTNGLINFTVSNSSIKQVEIFDAIGKRIMSINTSLSAIDVKELKAGIYIIKVKDGNQISTSKFVVK